MPDTPEKHLGPQCGHMLSQGLLSYRCTLPLGHGEGEEDPEPHYAVESPISVARWTQWRGRVDERLKADPETRTVIVCPECGGAMWVTQSEGECSECAATVPIASAKGASEHSPSSEEPEEEVWFEEQGEQPAQGTIALDAEPPATFSRAILDAVRPYLHEGTDDEEIVATIRMAVSDFLMSSA